jgi:hypothetical protein
MAVNKSMVTKIIGIAAMGLGFLATGIANWVSDQKMKETVQEEVTKQLFEKEESDEES